MQRSLGSLSERLLGAGRPLAAGPEEDGDIRGTHVVCPSQEMDKQKMEKRKLKPAHVLFGQLVHRTTVMAVSL